MPLPALPQNNTARLFVNYTTGAKEHSVILRLGLGASNVSNMQERFADFLNTIKTGLVNTWKVQSVEFQAAGAIVALPVATNPSLVSFVGTGGATIPLSQEAKQVRWVGRSPTSGRRASFGIYGITATVPNNYRFGPGEGPFATAATFTVLEFDSSTFVAIDGSDVTWYKYANIQYNSYWETELRG